ncbi:hypothetical protein ACKFKF_12845 [Phormidesmis sp. 146-12]
MQPTDINLKQAQPIDRPHLLLWQNPSPIEIWNIAFQNNAQEIDYRTDLLDRISPDANFLMLNRYLDREFDRLRTFCAESPKPIVLLKNFDCLITYLIAKDPNSQDFFWRKLFDLNHLQGILWIVLPPTLVPAHWSETRTQRILTLAL